MIRRLIVGPSATLRRLSIRAAGVEGAVVLKLEQLVATERRYEARTEARTAAEQALGTGGILYADSLERVRRRPVASRRVV